LRRRTLTLFPDNPNEILHPPRRIVNEKEELTELNRRGALRFAPDVPDDISSYPRFRLTRLYDSRYLFGDCRFGEQADRNH
jgi:hypothetical protein